MATFCEYNSGSHAAFGELTEELCRAEAHDVIVPSLSHLSDHPLVRDAMLTWLVFHANARVVAAQPHP